MYSTASLANALLFVEYVLVFSVTFLFLFSRFILFLFLILNSFHYKYLFQKTPIKAQKQALCNLQKFYFGLKRFFLSLSYLTFKIKENGH